MKMKKKRNLILINKKTLCAVIGLAVLVGLGLGFWRIQQALPAKFEADFYGKTEAIDIGKDEYEKMLNERKSFAVLVDSPTCVRSKKIEKMMGEMPKKYQFKYYRMMWSEVKESSLFNYVKFLPSLAIIKNGNVKSWLRADKDEDKAYYESKPDLQDWLIKNIEF